MVHRQRRSFSRREKRAFARILLAAIIAALFLLALAPGCSLRSYGQVKRKTEAVVAENERLLQETVRLREEIRLLQHDVKHLERIAREKYGMLRKNEEVYYLHQAASAESPPEEGNGENLP